MDKNNTDHKRVEAQLLPYCYACEQQLRAELTDPISIVQEGLKQLRDDRGVAVPGCYDAVAPSYDQ